MTEFEKKKWQWTIAMLCYCSLGYFFTNRIHFVSANPLSLSWIDRAVPFIPWTLFIYSSYYILMFLPLLLCKEESIFYRMLSTHLGIISIALLTFIFYPTTIHLWDYSSYNDFLTKYIYHLMRSLDTEYNASPSLHVALSLSGALVYLRYRKYKLGSIFLLWGILVSISTLTVKQHHFVDVVAAVALTLVVFVAVNMRSIEEKNIEGTE